MRLWLDMIAMAAALFLAVPAAEAIPPPMSPEELVEASDVVARVRPLAERVAADRDPVLAPVAVDGQERPRLREAGLDRRLGRGGPGPDRDRQQQRKERAASAHRLPRTRPQARSRWASGYSPAISVCQVGDSGLL